MIVVGSKFNDTDPTARLAIRNADKAPETRRVTPAAFTNREDYLRAAIKERERNGLSALPLRVELARLQHTEDGGDAA